MKEYTITATLETTHILKDTVDEVHIPVDMNTPDRTANFENVIKKRLNADDVKVKNVKVFEREV